jgi:predicted transcriptional regulator
MPGTKLTVWLKEAGLSQSELARRAGVSQQCVNAFCLGEQDSFRGTTAAKVLKVMRGVEKAKGLKPLALEDLVGAEATP